MPRTGAFTRGLSEVAFVEFLCCKQRSETLCSSFAIRAYHASAHITKQAQLLQLKVKKRDISTVKDYEAVF